MALSLSTCRSIRRCGASGTGRSGGACARATGRKAGRSSTRTRCRACAAPSTRASRLTARPRAPAIPSSPARVQSPQSDSLRSLRVRRWSLSALLAAAIRAHKRGRVRCFGPQWGKSGGLRWGGARQKGVRVCGICGCRGRVWVDDNIQLCVCPWSRSVGSVGRGPGGGRMIDGSRVYESRARVSSILHTVYGVPYGNLTRYGLFVRRFGLRPTGSATERRPSRIRR